MAMVMLFLRQTTGKTERYTHFCMSLKPVFTRDCGNGVHFMDEPVNGLDPKNIVALRTLLKKLSEENHVTIVISSHILSELYLLATDYIFIHKGKIIEVLTHDELEAKCRKYVCIKTEQVPFALTVLDKVLEGAEYKVVSGNTIYLYSDLDKVETIARAFMQQDIVVTELSVMEQTLEDYFIAITGGAGYV